MGYPLGRPLFMIIQKHYEFYLANKISNFNRLFHYPYINLSYSRCKDSMFRGSVQYLKMGVLYDNVLLDLLLLDWEGLLSLAFITTSCVRSHYFTPSVMITATSNSD